jgi:hypothetical protein
LALDDTLTPIGPDGYVLPTLEDIETSHATITGGRAGSHCFGFDRRVRPAERPWSYNI